MHIQSHKHYIMTRIKKK